MDLRQIGTLYLHEVRCALRERSIVVASIVVPLVLYPATLWAVFAGVSVVEGQAERITSRVAVQGLPEAHRPLADSLEADGRISVREWEGEHDIALDQVARGGLDAFLIFESPEPAAAALADNFRAVLFYNEARDRSTATRSRIEAAVADYRQAWIHERRRGLGVSDPTWADFAVAQTDVATPEESARFTLGLVIPFLTLVMVALAAFYPAIDATAGERERSTWETLMTVAAPHGNVAAAKYLYVATFGALGGLLNLGALALSLGWILDAFGGPDAADAAQGGIPLAALPFVGLGVALLGLFVAAAMLVFAVFARNFKEGQSMITPVYVVIFIPAFFVQSPDLEFTPGLAAIPVVNVAMLIREAITGSVPPVAGGIALATMSLCVVGAVAFAQWVMRREEVLLGTGRGGLWSFLKRRFTDGKGTG